MKDFIIKPLFVLFLFYCQCLIIPSALKANLKIKQQHNLTASENFTILHFKHKKNLKELQEIFQLKDISTKSVRHINHRIFIIKKEQLKLKKQAMPLNEFKEKTAYAPNSSAWPHIPTHRLHAKFKTSTTLEEQKALLQAHQLKKIKSFSFNSKLVILEAPKHIDSQKLAKQLFKSNHFDYIYPDFYLPIDKKMTPNDTFYPDQWHHEASDAGLHSEAAWEITQGDQHIKIAVLDDGTDTTHEDLEILKAKDFTGKGNIDQGLHGTACSGIIGAKGNNHKGITGICMNCSLLVAKVIPTSGYSLESTLVNALLWANEQEADIINNSWGISNNININNYFPLLVETLNHIRKTGRHGKGGLIVLSSGNENRRISDHALEALDAFITVGAIDYFARRSWYSNYGKALDFVAPSSTGFIGNPKDAIITTDVMGDIGYNIDGEGFQYPKTGPERLGFDLDTLGNYTKYFGGTSAAAPMVSGVLGLMLSENSELTTENILYILKKTTDKISIGYDENGHSENFGYGKINAYKALNFLRHEVENCNREACNNHGFCLLIENQKHCTCDEGFEKDEALGCIKPVTPCDTVDCGDYGYCQVKNEEASCVCEEGYHEENLNCIKSPTPEPPNSPKDSASCQFSHKTTKKIGNTGYFSIIYIILFLSVLYFRKRSL